MTAFEFATAGRVIFGDGASAGVPELAAGWGARVLVVAASDPARAEWLVTGLEQRGAEVALLCVEDEPDTSFVEGGAGLARRRGIEAVVGLGGGSALDAAKAIAALATNPGELMDYLEVVGRGQPITAPPLPLVAVPTTAGTGSEVTRNAVVTVPGRRVKASLRSPLMLPRAAVVDPRLTYGLPPALTASTGLDALTQLIEPFVSLRANPVADALCREGLARASRSLCRACEDGRDAAARTDMSLASLLGGMALASAGLGAVHGLAAPIGGMFRAPHGAVCAALLPHVMAANLRALGEGRGRPNALGRMAEIGRLVTRSPEATAEDAVAWIRGTVARLEIPGLSRYGMAADALPEVAAQGLQASSMKGNPVALSAAELVGILEAAL
ncbi:MAG TPA: iron-containing alcohol dehydrogenase [Vicinamibacterales bacterium]|nr:iron-containing alcohol dehydrogenase [Vicinamibacterales bacterium]HPW20614.1 iron-containing alcohol dehydrogenase [Vicinamibacterales bacterium]